MEKPRKRLSAVNTGAADNSGSASGQTANTASHLAILSDVAQLLSGVGAFEAKTGQVANRMAQAADADWVALRIPDDFDSGLRLIASAGYEPKKSPLPDVLAYNQGMAGRAYTDAKSIVAHDYPGHADAAQYHIAAGAKSGLTLPIFFDGKVTGVFAFGSREPGHFPYGRVGLLEAIAGQLGPLLENARLQQELALTDEIASIITSTLDIDDVYEKFAVAMSGSDSKQE